MAQSSELQTTADGNQQFGEAYAAFWSQWLERTLLACQAHLADQNNPIPAGRLPSKNAGYSNTLAALDNIHREFGNGAIVAGAFGRDAALGFEPINLVLQQARSPREFVASWRALVRAQQQVRGSTAMDEDFVLEAGRDTIVLTPSQIKPASLSAYGPAMLGGVMLRTLVQMPGGRAISAWELRRAGSTRQVMREGTLIASDFEYDSSWLVTLTRAAVGGDRPREHAAMQRAQVLVLDHLVSRGAVPLMRRLVHVLQTGEGRHRTLRESAVLLGTSARTLQRRLGQAGISYGRISRFVRLRAACMLIAQGDSNLDDVAFQADYADRHHLAREFRRMAMISPSAYRDAIRSEYK